LSLKRDEIKKDILPMADRRLLNENISGIRHTKATVFRF